MKRKAWLPTIIFQRRALNFLGSIHVKYVGMLMGNYIRLFPHGGDFNIIELTSTTIDKLSTLGESWNLAPPFSLLAKIIPLTVSKWSGSSHNTILRGLMVINHISLPGMMLQIKNVRSWRKFLPPRYNSGGATMICTRITS